MTFKVFLLGQFKLQADELLLELPSRPAQSLLAYLGLHLGVTHRREKLASLLWPETNETNARAYLRQALWRIRKTLKSGGLEGDDYLQVDDLSITFVDQPDVWIDADRFLKTPDDRPLEDSIQAICLYRGELLPGFYDEWVVLERDRLASTYHRKMDRLMTQLLEAGRWQDVLVWGEEWIRLGYSPEPAFRAIMQAYAKSGNSDMVLGTYRRCEEALQRELDLQPSTETKELYEQLRHESIRQAGIPTELKITQQPSFLTDRRPQLVDTPVFVARKREIEQLQGFLERVTASQGRVVFITGEAGSGKTALINEFVRRAQEKHPDVIVAGGNCNAHTGVGDPFLPFREILELLTGDVEARWMAGAITREQARSLWNTLPTTVRALLEAGPDLVNTFLSGSALLARSRAYSSGEMEWLSRLDEVVKRGTAGTMLSGPHQKDFLEQYTRVMQTLAKKAVLVVVIDDLQWADPGSISLLFHLGRNLAGSRILILGAYRPEEVALGRDGNRHPLEPVVNEFQRMFGKCIVKIDQREGRCFVNALIDSEPNRLGEAFRRMLYRQTLGHPLFTIELLRGMQERGDLIQDPEGMWIEGQTLDWELLPERVEAVIAERIGRLNQSLQSILRAASVEGDVFTGEVVAGVRDSDEREMLEQLSEELDRKHHLIQAHSVLRIDDQLLSRYSFRHTLYQIYLYGSLDEVERVHLHERVGTALEGYYGDREEGPSAADIAPQLARHFQEAGKLKQAIRYLLKAGEKATLLSAYQEAIVHLSRGLSLLESLPDSAERTRMELPLQLALGWAWMANGTPSPRAKKAFTRARGLCLQTGEIDRLCLALCHLSTQHYVRAEYEEALDLAEEASGLAQQTQDPMLIAKTHWHIGFVLFGLGDYIAAHNHLMQAIDAYDPEQHYNFVFLFGVDGGLGAMAYDACCLWCLGFPDQAERRRQQAMEQARGHKHPFSLADVLCYGGCMLDAMRQDAKALKEHAEELIQLAQKTGFPGWLATATSYLGEALAMIGQVQDGIAQIQQGMVVNQSLDVWCDTASVLRSLAAAYFSAGRIEEALDALENALSLVEKTGGRHWEAELHRLRAEILIGQGEDEEAEASLHKALEVARRQYARSWELRAVMSLARLWKKQGRSEEARQLLREVYASFTEGFETPDLKEAKALLDSLS